MTIILNGKPHPLAGISTVAELISTLNISGRYAVELNASILPRSRHAQQILHDGDKLEIVAAVGGG